MQKRTTPSRGLGLGLGLTIRGSMDIFKALLKNKTTPWFGRPAFLSKYLRLLGRLIDSLCDLFPYCLTFICCRDYDPPVQHVQKKTCQCLWVRVGQRQTPVVIPSIQRGAILGSDQISVKHGPPAPFRQAHGPPGLGPPGPSSVPRDTGCQQTSVLVQPSGGIIAETGPV